MYFHDNDGAMIEHCSELAQMLPPLNFLLTGFPIAEPDAGRPSYAMRSDRTPVAA